MGSDLREIQLAFSGRNLCRNGMSHPLACSSQLGTICGFLIRVRSSSILEPRVSVTYALFHLLSKIIGSRRSTSRVNRISVDDVEASIRRQI